MRRGARPTVGQDERARDAIERVFGRDSIASLGWAMTTRETVEYDARVYDDGAARVDLRASVLSDGAVVMVGEMRSARLALAAFVCGCGEMLASTRSNRRADEIARLDGEEDGPAACCRACASKRTTLVPEAA